jgi:hypothetical protein
MEPDFNPPTTNVAELLRWLSAVPFSPFQIIVSSGARYEIPTPDHITIMRISRRVVVEYDDDRPGAYIHPLHITSIEPLSPAA